MAAYLILATCLVPNNAEVVLSAELWAIHRIAPTTKTLGLGQRRFPARPHRFPYFAIDQVRRTLAAQDLQDLLHGMLKQASPAKHRSAANMRKDDNIVALE